MSDNGEGAGGVKSLKKWVRSFMDGPYDNFFLLARSCSYVLHESLMGGYNRIFDIY